MMERMHSGADLHPPEEDFEWVNAWAAASARERSAPALTDVPAAAPAHVPARSQTAGDAVVVPAASGSVSTVEADAKPETGAAPTSAAQPIDEEVPAAPPSPATPLREPLAAIETIGADDAGPSLIVEIESLPPVDTEPPSSARRPWTSLFRLIAGGAGQPTDRPTDLDDVTETVSAELPAPGAIEIEHAASVAIQVVPAAPGANEISSLLPQDDHAHIPLAPDQLERDIAEIEIVRDQLLTQPEPLELAGEAASVRSRTTDLVPVLVGAALGFILLVVFGAAASLVSLR